MMAKNKDNETSFEQDLERLDEIVKRLEEGDLPLEEAVSLFKEGTALSRKCSKKLDEAEARIEMIVEDGEKLDKKELKAE
jgi:exodeoxyribonuclease VII small subunit